MDISKITSEAIEGIFTIFSVLIVIRIGLIIGTVALITWVVKLVWNAGSKPKQTKRQKHSNDWLEEAQYRQHRRNEYNDPPIKSHQKRNNGYSTGNTKWYPTGWSYNEDKGLWEPPDYLKTESDDKWEWDPEKRIWIDTEKKRRKERYEQFRRESGKGPTYEEWKAAREAEQGSGGA